MAGIPAANCNILVVFELARFGVGRVFFVFELVLVAAWHVEMLGQLSAWSLFAALNIFATFWARAVFQLSDEKTQKKTQQLINTTARSP